jgi:hypothetical protein
MSQAGAFLLVKISKSEHSNLTGSLVFDKTCTASLDTILFITKMDKIGENRSILYKDALSTDSLLVTYDHIKFKPRSKEENLTRR